MGEENGGSALDKKKAHRERHSGILSFIVIF